jgi:hypothetical protein
MKILRCLIWLAAIDGFAAVSIQAGDTLPDTQLAKRGRLLISEDLAKAPADIIADTPLTKMKSGWKLWSGQWKFEDDVMKGTQLASEGRGAVAACVFPFTNAIFQFDVRLEDCRQMRFRFQDSTPEHICSVIMTKDGFSAQKDDHDHGGPDKAESFGNLSFAIPPVLQAHQRAGPPNPWHTVLVEIVGTKMNVNIRGLNILGGHPLIGSPKAFFDFVVSGGSASFRNLRVWEALPK